MSEERKCSSMEALLICAQSANPNSVLLLDPFSGTTLWSLRGSEFRQGILQTAEPIGAYPSFLCVALADKPSLHLVPLAPPASKEEGVCSPRCASVGSSLAYKVRFLQTHPCGRLLFVGAENKLLTWEIHSGQLLSMVEAHLREISAMRISPCGHFIVSASLDGDAKVFMTANLIAERGLSLSSADVSPLAVYSPHSLPISDLFLSGGAHSVSSLRILSVSADHSAALYSLATRQILLRVTADRSLTACCMDPAELRIFLAAESAPIYSLDLCGQFSDRFVSFSAAPNSSSAPSASSFIRRFDHQHNASVLKLSVCADGTRMASGDEKGAYCVWDTTNGQCLLSGSLHGPISTLSFRRHWSPTDDPSKNGHYSGRPTPVATLQRNLSTKRSLKMATHWRGMPKGTGEESAVKSLDGLLGILVKLINSGERILVSRCEQSAVPNVGKRPLLKTADGKKRRISREKSPPTKSLQNGGVGGGGAVCATNDPGATSERELLLAEEVRRLRRELARVVQLNAELYNYSTNMVLEESCTEKNVRRGNN